MDDRITNKAEIENMTDKTLYITSTNRRQKNIEEKYEHGTRK